jgi:hypothetical protein
MKNGEEGKGWRRNSELKGSLVKEKEEEEDDEEENGEEKDERGKGEKRKIKTEPAEETVEDVLEKLPVFSTITLMGL